jgi:hypothetical protein
MAEKGVVLHGSLVILSLGVIGVAGAIGVPWAGLPMLVSVVVNGWYMLRYLRISR